MMEPGRGCIVGTVMSKTAKLYRMVTNEHICPFGLKSKHLLQTNGFELEDRHLKSRAEADAFMAEHDVKTTPQTFIDGKRIGGYGDLREYFGLGDPQKKKGMTYQPVIAVFAVAFLMAFAASWVLSGLLSPVLVLEYFVAFSMCILAVLKLRDLFAFTNQFLGYDLLAQKWVPYATIYPFAEAFVGIGMIARVWPWLVAPVAIFIGSVGAYSVYKAVYIDKRDLKCACVGGNSNVPLGVVSLTENLMMVVMGAWMLIKSMLL